MPSLLCEHDSIRRRRIELQNHLARFDESCTIELLALRVQLFELARNRVCLVLIRRQEKLHALQRASDPARCVESWTEDVADSSGSDRPSLESGSANHRPQSDVLGFGEHLQAVANENTILTTQLRDVGDSCERNEIQHSPDESVVLLELLCQCERKLECNRDSGEILVGIFASHLLRIENSETFRQRLAWQVVVGNDDIDSLTAQLCNWLSCTCAAVTRHDQRRMRIDSCAHSRFAQVVSILETPRNERNRLRAE